MIPVLLFLGSPAIAQAPPLAPAEPNVTDRGKELYDNGVLLYNEGRYEQAIAAWREGYELSGRPGFLFNIANAYERLAAYDDALTALAEYRAFASAEQRATLDRRLRALEARRDEAEAREEALRAEATPEPEPPPPALEEPITEPVVRRRPPILGLSLLGAGAVGLGSGVGLGLASRGSASQATTNCAMAPDGWLCPDAAQPALTRSRRQALGADVSFVLAGALAATGVVATLLRPATGDEGASVQLGADGISLTYAWTGP
ncbi:MAG: hypothetical protein KTR31_30770 [Myxococcales bacterium]|nr:hypothetical protein [Myxococcales bacterium]